jgi:hypothetical protein
MSFIITQGLGTSLIVTQGYGISSPAPTPTEPITLFPDPFTSTITTTYSGPSEYGSALLTENHGYILTEGGGLLLAETATMDFLGHILTEGGGYLLTEGGGSLTTETACTDLYSYMLTEGGGFLLTEGGGFLLTEGQGQFFSMRSINIESSTPNPIASTQYFAF